MSVRLYGAVAALSIVAATVTPNAGAQSSTAGTANELAAWPGYGRFVSTAAVGARGPNGAYTLAVDADRTVASAPGRAPLEVDLRSFAMIPTSDGYVAALQFLGPVTHLTTIEGRPVTHEVAVVLTPPSGPAVTLSSADSASQVAFFGNQVLIAIPHSSGVASDWTVQPTVTVRFDDQKGWKSTTPPVRVGALTSESPGGLRLVQSGNELDAVVHLSAPAASVGDVTVTLFAPDDRGGTAPLSLDWHQTAPTAAFVSTATTRGVASVPVRVDSNDLTFVLTSATPLPTANKPATADTSLDGSYDVPVDAAVGCQCPDDRQPSGTAEPTTWQIQIEGPNIGIIDLTTGKTAIGRVDQTYGEFAASNATESYGGHVGGGGDELTLDVTKVELPSTGGSGNGAGLPTTVEPVAYVDPLSDFVKQAGDVLRKIMDRLFPPKTPPPTATPTTPPPPPKTNKASVKKGVKRPPLVIKFLDPAPLTEIGPPGDIITLPPLDPPRTVDDPPVDPPWPVITPPQTSTPDGPATPAWPFDDITKPPKRKQWAACAQTKTEVLPCATAAVLLAAPASAAAGGGATATVVSRSGGSSSTPFVVGGVVAAALAVGFVLFRRRVSGRGTA
jgi:hypothetical protein